MTSLAEALGSEAGRAVIVGVGLIGGSIALALRAAGWHVSGIDLDAGARAVRRRGAIDAVGDDELASPRRDRHPRRRRGLEAARGAPRTPPGPGAARDRRRRGQGGDLREHRRSSLHRGPSDGRLGAVGIDGARADLFVGASWVLTPAPRRRPTALRPPGRDHHERSGAQTLALPAS